MGQQKWFSLDTGVPWVMCKEDEAPDPVINACNGFYCDAFTPNKPYKPKLWTEAWSGWFAEFGSPNPHRPVEDLAFAVARFILKGGAFANYYMYHGGTNFGRSAGGPFITTSYDYDAPIDEYGLIREPKYGHLKELHRAIKLSEHALVSSDPTVTRLGTYQQAHVFTSGRKCAAFLSNFHFSKAARVFFNNLHYDLPAWSVSILPDCRNVVFNTARVGTQNSQMAMAQTSIRLLSWETYDEDLSSLDEGSKLTAVGLLEQVNLTRDSTDYLWYTTSLDVHQNLFFKEVKNLFSTCNLQEMLFMFSSMDSTQAQPLDQGKIGNSHILDQSISFLELIKFHCSVSLLDCRILDCTMRHGRQGSEVQSGFLVLIKENMT